jgi:hypothetical protein
MAEIKADLHLMAVFSINVSVCKILNAAINPDMQ